MSDNVLGERRTGLALLNLQATPMVPGVNASDSNPQKADGHIINTNTRTLFPAWPDDSVVKVRDTSTAALKNVLTLKCRPFQDYVVFIKTDINYDAAGVELLTVIGAVWNPNNWGNGDNKIYTSATVYLNYYLGKIDHDNDPNTPDVDAWNSYTIPYQYDFLAGALMPDAGGITNVNPSLTELTTANAFMDQSLLIGGGPGNGTAYITYTGATDYDSAFAAYSPTDPPTYPTVSHVFSARKDDDDPHGLKSYVVVYADDTIQETDLKFGFHTYVLAGTNTEGGWYQRQLVRARWHYAPDAGLCGTCPFAGKTVTIEAKFKQATVTRTVLEHDGASPLQSITIGSWSDHSTETFTITLPDTLTAGDIGSEFDFPTAAGKVVVLDDLRLVSIS
jgi:hypothetical protein